MHQISLISATPGRVWCDLQSVEQPGASACQTLLQWCETSVKLAAGSSSITP